MKTVDLSLFFHIMLNFSLKQNNTDNEMSNSIEHPEYARRPTGFSVLSTNAKKLDIRAHQRTYQGLYMRTTLGTLSFAILVLKFFSKEFLRIGILYTIYGLVIFIISFVRLQSMDLYYLKEIKEFQGDHTQDSSNDTEAVFFKTSGNFILLITTISLISYCLLFVFIYKM